jgi:hypothetical protein
MLECETRGAFLLAFEIAELLGREEANDISDEQRALLRLLTPIAKLLTAKQAVMVVSECIEAFGGAGYVEDTGLPVLLRDTQVLPIWEGTTNVLALDAVLRSNLDAGLAAVRSRIDACLHTARDTSLMVAPQAVQALDHVQQWLRDHAGAHIRQAGARRLAMTIGRALQLALLIEHAQWQLDHDNDRSGLAAVARYASAPVDLLAETNLADSRALYD